MKTINQCTKLKSLKEIEKEVYNLHKTKHRTDVNTYNLKIVNEIIYNEKSRIVAIFKDYLILDDISEFLRRFYNNTESNVRLNKVISFYEAYSRIFPNYIIIPESKYLYKNIRRKQKMIDAYNQIKAEEEENRKCVNDVIIKNKNNKKDNFFDSEIRRSILRYQPSYNFDNSYLNNRTQSIINWQDAVNDSTHTSHLNKNIIENEESILSIQNILKAMDKRNIGPLSNRLLISNKIKSSRNSLEKSKKAVGVLDDSKKILKSILSETNLKPKNMVNNIGFIINSNGNIEGYGHLQAHNIKSNNNLQNNLYFQSTPTINNKSSNLQSGSNSLRKKLEKYEKLEKTENKNINHKPVQKGEHKDILNNFSSNNPIFSLQSNGIKSLEKPSSIKVTPSSKNINNKIDIIDELVLQNQEQNRAQHISPGPEISERKLEPPSAIFKNRLATHRVSSSIPELYNTVKIINHYPSIIIPQGSTHVSINQNYYNYGNSFASPVGTRIITIENYNGSSTNTSKSKINKKKTYSESFEPQNSGLKRTKTSSNSKEILSKSNSNFKGNPVNSHITSPTNLKIKSKENKETLVNTGSTYNSLNTNNSTVKKIKFNEGVHKNNYISIGNSQTIQIQQNTLQSLSNQQNGHVPISTQNIETNISSPKTGGKQVYSKVFKVFQENFKNISSYKSKNQKNVENLPDNNLNLLGSDVGSQNIKKENLENLIMQDDFGYLESDRQFKSRLEIRDAYKKYLERNKLECLTARNSLDKVSYPYKGMNSDLNGISRVYMTTHNSVNFNSSNNVSNNGFMGENKTFYDKRGLCLSPTVPERSKFDPNNKTHQSKHSHAASTSNPNNSKLAHYSQKLPLNAQKIETPRKNKIVKQPTLVKEEYSHNKSRMKSYFGQQRESSQVNPQPQSTKKMENIKNVFSNGTNKLNFKSGVVKSLDFQTLKNHIK